MHLNPAIPHWTRDGRMIIVGPERPTWPTQPCLDSLIRWTAYQRGLCGSTFATADEARHPGYDLAYRAGARRRLSDPLLCMSDLQTLYGKTP